MTHSNHTLLPLAAFLVGAFAFSADAAVVYQDNFDNDGLATNTGTGGGLFAYDRQGGPWLDNGVLDSNRGGNNDRGNAISINAFDLTGGFTLEVTYQIDNVTTLDANRAIIALIDESDVPAAQTNTTYITDFLNRNLNMYGIGMNLTVQNSTQGFNFSNGTDLLELSNVQTISTGTHTVSLTVDADSNWSYSIDGSSATTGTLPEAFNFGTNYQFVTYMQDNHNKLKIESVTLSVGLESVPLALVISQSGGNLDFEWNSMSGMQYDLVSNTDLTTNPSTWLPYNDGVTTHENILSSGTGTQNLPGVLKVDSARFFALIEEPITPLFSEDFEGNDGGFTVVDNTLGETGTDWAHGDPDSSGLGGSVTVGNGGSTNCWGTNLGAYADGAGDPGFYANPTDTCLRSAVIDLTGVTAAELSFAQALDLDAGDTVTVNIIDDTTDTVIESDIVSISDGAISTADWETVGPVAIPAAALGQEVRVEWCLSGTGGTSFDFMGWYIDDVVVTPTTP